MKAVPDRARQNRESSLNRGRVEADRKGRADLSRRRAGTQLTSGAVLEKCVTSDNMFRQVGLQRVRALIMRHSLPATRRGLLSGPFLVVALDRNYVLAFDYRDAGALAQAM